MDHPSTVSDRVQFGSSTRDMLGSRRSQRSIVGIDARLISGAQTIAAWVFSIASDLPSPADGA